MTDNRDAILDIGECVADMDYAHLATELIGRKRLRATAESREIAQILDRIPQLERAGRRTVTTFGQQVVWRKRNESSQS